MLGVTVGTVVTRVIIAIIIYVVTLVVFAIIGEDSTWYDDSHWFYTTPLLFDVIIFVLYNSWNVMI